MFLDAVSHSSRDDLHTRITQMLTVTTFVAVSDVLETIAIYGSDYFPSEIMVGDTTLSNWIQLLNQTLSNQQAVIDSLQASLDSQDTQLDSIMIADMIAAAGGLGSGGGCDYAFPEGIGQVIIEKTSAVSYTVPEGKHLYITYFKNGWISNSNLPENEFFNPSSNNPNLPFVFDSGEGVRSNPNLTSYFQGFLVDAISSITPITDTIENGGLFTIPNGKNLYLFHWDGGAPVVHTNEFSEDFDHLENLTASSSRINPLVITSGNSIGTTVGGFSYFNGYLVDEDYFADCGGGGSSGGGLLNTEFGDTEHHSFFELDWQQQTNSSGYFIPLQFESDGIFRISGGNAGFKYILVPDSVSEDQFFNETLAEANFFDTFWEGGNPEFTMPLNSDEQLVLYGGTGVVEEGTTSGSMSLFWTPLETQINEGGDGSSEGEDDDVTVEFDAGYISNEDTVFVPESADRVYLSIGGGNGHLALPNDNSYKRIEIIQEGTTGGNIDIFGQPSSNSQYLDVVAGDWQGIGIGIRNREGFWRIIEN